MFGKDPMDIFCESRSDWQIKGMTPPRISPVTLKDVASKAGVATNTASSILNDRRDSWASEETKRRVREAAKRMGYRPNRLAVSLSSGKSKTIGLLIPDLQNPFFSALVSEIEDQIIRHDLDLIIENSRLDIQRERICLQNFASRQIDGLILVSMRPGALRKDLEQMVASGRNLVLLGEPPEKTAFNCVRVDLAGAINQAFKHLADLGHRRVGLILHSLMTEREEALRLKNFKEALAGNSLVNPRSCRIYCKPTMEDAKRAFCELLRKPHDNFPTAFVCMNDFIAVGAMKAAIEAGLEIPRDISFVGVDDIPIARYLPVALSTISQSIAEMAEAAVRLLISGRTQKARTITLHGNFIPRESSGPRTDCGIVQPRSPGDSGKD